MSTHRTDIDREACSAFGSCFSEDPATFAAGPDGIATTRTEMTDREKALAAARSDPR